MPTQTYGRFGTFLTACAVVALIATLALTGLSVPNASALLRRGDDIPLPGDVDDDIPRPDDPDDTPRPDDPGGGPCGVSIEYFHPFNSTIDVGQSTTLFWLVQVSGNNCYVLVDLAAISEGGVGVPLTGSKIVQPYSTTTYGLIATVLPQLSTVSATTTVTVTPLTPLPEIPATCPTHVYLGNTPGGTDLPDWSENAQGIANDGQHWFFTHKTGLLKYHKTWGPSDGDDLGKLGSVSFPPELEAIGISADGDDNGHFGDPDYYNGYIFVPFESNHKTVIGAFRAADLAFMDWVEVSAFQSRAGWVAIDPVEQMLYTSHDRIVAGTPLQRYAVDVSKLDNGQPGDFLTQMDPIALLEADGSKVVGQFIYMQGGVFTPWGDLYLAVGKAGDSPAATRGGIHLFRRAPDGSAFLLVESSVNVSASAGAPVFAYEYHPGSTGLGQEPEGLDWWDRDVPDALPYKGQLHAILLDNQAGDDQNLAEALPRRLLRVCRRRRQRRRRVRGGL